MSADRKAAILDAASVLFASTAFDQVTVQRICAAAGLGNGSFFHVFSTKQALAADLYEQACCERDQLVAKALSTNPGDAHGAVLAVVAVLARFAGGQDRAARLLRNLYDAVAGDPRFAKDRDGLVGLFPIIAAWQAQVSIARRLAPLPPRVVASLLLAPVRAVMESDGADQARASHEIIELLAERVWLALQGVPARDRRAGRVAAASAKGQAPDADLFSALGETARSRQ